MQGLGGALLSPAALSILTVTFAHGRERNLAMGVWGGLAGLGGSLGAIIGGTLVARAPGRDHARSLSSLRQSLRKADRAR